MSGISQKLAYNLRDEVSKKINRLPMSYFDKTTNGEVLSRFTNDIDTLAQSLNQSLTQIITAVTTLVGVFIMMLTISGIMTVAALVIIPIGMFAISMIIKRSQKFFAQQQEFLGNVNGQVEELYGGHLVVQAFNGQGDAIEKFDKTNEKLYQSAWKSQFLSGLMQPLMSFIGNLGYVLISRLGGFLVIKNYRNKHLAKNLMTKAIEFVKNDLKEEHITLSAQYYIKNLYSSLGFKEISPIYDECNIPHVKMRL